MRDFLAHSSESRILVEKPASFCVILGSPGVFTNVNPCINEKALYMEALNILPLKYKNSVHEIYKPTQGKCRE